MKEGDEDRKERESWALKINGGESESSLVCSSTVPPFPLTDLDICPLLGFLR